MIWLSFSMQLPLHDIVVDHQVSWWPLALGWWLVIAILLASLTGAWFYWRHWQRRRTLKLKVETLLKAPAQSISELNLRLKQVLLLKYPRATLANLEEQAWLQKLIAEVPAAQRDEFQNQFAAFTELRYRPQQQASVDSYQRLVLDWWSSAQPHFVKEVKDV